jgi:hypothetical protein
VPESVAVLVARACMCTTTCLSYPIFTFITRMAIVDVLYSGTEDDRDRMYVALSIYTQHCERCCAHLQGQVAWRRWCV